jgi:hypothetical protein
MGIARITPFIPIVIQPRTIHKKIITGLTPKFCLKSNGIKTLFSIRCIQNITHHETINQVSQFEILAIIITGIHHKSGQR